MKTITAPENYVLEGNEIACFLAGGITDCPDWQNEVVQNFKTYDATFPGELDNLVLFNPRRPSFPINDPNAAQQQIEWEFKWLQCMDIFSMFFTAGHSDQPICMYELGRNICKMIERFPLDYSKRIVISCDPLYKRAQDVKIQTQLAFDASEMPCIIDKADPLTHMYHVIRSFNYIKQNPA